MSAARRTTVYVVRHAKAGSRRNWAGPDQERPLSTRGRRQADLLAKSLGDRGVERVISSGYLRCVETVTPLAARLGLTVEQDQALAEGADDEDALALIDSLACPTVLCTHGDVLGGLLHHAHRHGVSLDDDRIEKASTWVLELVEGAIVAASYELPPPS